MSTTNKNLLCETGILNVVMKPMRFFVKRRAVTLFALVNELGQVIAFFDTQQECYHYSKINNIALNIIS